MFDNICTTNIYSTTLFVFLWDYLNWQVNVKQKVKATSTADTSNSACHHNVLIKPVSMDL